MKPLKELNSRVMSFGVTTIDMYPTFGAKYLKLRYTPNNAYKLLYLLSKYIKQDDNISVHQVHLTAPKKPSKPSYVIITFESILYSKWTEKEVSAKYSANYSNLIETVQAVKASSNLSIEILDLFYKSISISHQSQESQDEKMLGWLTSENKSINYYNWYENLTKESSKEPNEEFNKYDVAAQQIKRRVLANNKANTIDTKPF
ncbi:MAG: hypothetical protein P8P29_09460 [Flavobacteriaceae bacterium]|nr:hypothetical protein [Flavobacteriaceae bacterium]